MHFPVTFISLSASIACICGEFGNEILNIFFILRTVSEHSIIAFPEDSFAQFPVLPWDSSFEAPLPGIVLAPVITPKPAIAKIDFQITARPQTQLRKQPFAGPAKPKSALDSLGF
jgi:hypothetical protein